MRKKKTAPHERGAGGKEPSDNWGFLKVVLVAMIIINLVTYIICCDWHPEELMLIGSMILLTFQFTRVVCSVD